jgi:4-hydroxy-3-polyprenylbenzoate decarboxylase
MTMSDRIKTQAPINLQDHLQRLEEKGLLQRIERDINKDSELHPLVRWQFQGGIPAEDRKAFFLIV